MTARTSSARRQALEQASSAILQKMYQQSAAGSQARRCRPAPGRSRTKKDDVLDAEFEEVKESDRKKA